MLFVGIVVAAAGGPIYVAVGVAAFDYMIAHCK